MALNIRNAEAEQLAEALAALTGETKTEAVTQALRDRLSRLRRERARRFALHDRVRQTISGTRENREALLFFGSH